MSVESEPAGCGFSMHFRIAPSMEQEEINDARARLLGVIALGCAYGPCPGAIPDEMVEAFDEYHQKALDEWRTEQVLPPR